MLDANGATTTYFPGGDVTTANNAFFKSLVTNGRPARPAISRRMTGPSVPQPSSPPTPQLPAPGLRSSPPSMAPIAPRPARPTPRPASSSSPSVRSFSTMATSASPCPSRQLTTGFRFPLSRILPAAKRTRLRPAVRIALLLPPAAPCHKRHLHHPRRAAGDPESRAGQHHVGHPRAEFGQPVQRRHSHACAGDGRAH